MWDVAHVLQLYLSGEAKYFLEAKWREYRVPIDSSVGK
jgi:hypothetical protein